MNSKANLYSHSENVADADEESHEKEQVSPGWDEERVRRVISFYEEQSEEEALAEDEAAFEDQGLAVMEIPKELVPSVREMIAKHQAGKESGA